ncbi:hypothetical protein H5410_037830 [Solanum commersonii]|uniref:Ulp1 protease family, C-terminal catalytic domain containing protein n=1 Tax=Solanum commersonii TaxID=4109 RepID=A0A9J5YC99_SOLCO|nr:hypothetical protein H5410_037830 [Solanum commersonii]
MKKTPRKSPRLNKSMVVVDSPPISCSRPSDDYGADTKSKGKERLVEDHYPHDNDFADEFPLSKRLRVNNDQDLKNVDGGSVNKGMKGLSQKWARLITNKRKKATQVPSKIKKKQSCWCSYVNVNVFVDITKLLVKIGSVHLFKESPFGYLLDLSQLKVQPQIIRSLVHHLSNNRDDMFFISWVVQIHDVWEANDKDESLISIHHEVAQYIRGDRILGNTPWVDVDHVCIPVNSSAAFH